MLRCSKFLTLLTLLSPAIGFARVVPNVTDENTLTLTIPSASSGPEDIALRRGDGQTYTLENAVVLP